jgi:hypothetical protein
MMTAVFLLLALLLGYATTVALSLACVFGIASLSRGFVVKDLRITGRYRVAQDLLWLPCTGVGGYIASWVGMQVNQWILGGALIAVIVGVLWSNVWEMRQRGIPHQIAMTLISVAGVVLGFLLRIEPVRRYSASFLVQ